MTFTSIPPSLRPVVGSVMDVMDEAPGFYVKNMRALAEAVILAFLNSCVERKIGWYSEPLAPLEPSELPIHNAALVLNLGATDDTA